MKIESISKEMIDEIHSVSKIMFEKHYFGVFRGSISHKLNESKFLINTSNAIFSDKNESNFTALSHKRDYNWQDASKDAFIHSYIYKACGEARCIIYALPTCTIGYSLENDSFIPKDYFGHKLINQAAILNPKDYHSWIERTDVEIGNHFKQYKTNFVIVRGYGIFAYERNVYECAKIIATIENSARILLAAHLAQENVFEDNSLQSLF